MRIDGTFGTESYGLQNGKGESGRPVDSAASGRAGAKDPPSAASPGVAPWVRRSAGADEVNAQAVEEARRALQAGALDTPDAARRAARAILEMGF